VSTAEPLTLVLPSALTIERPLAKLLAFAREEYETYDAVVMPLESTITIHDITLTMMVNSRLTAPGARSIYRARERIERGLAYIPADVSLLNDHAAVPWDAIYALFNEFETIKGAKLAIATKILHRKRPHLIPMIDNKVFGHYAGGCPTLLTLKMGPVAVRSMELFRDDLLAVRGRVEALTFYLEEHGFPLTPVRVLEILIWVECNKQEPYYSAV